MRWFRVEDPRKYTICYQVCSAIQHISGWSIAGYGNFTAFNRMSHLKYCSIIDLPSTIKRGFWGKLAFRIRVRKTICKSIWITNLISNTAIWLLVHFAFMHEPLTPRYLTAMIGGVWITVGWLHPPSQPSDMRANSTTTAHELLSRPDKLKTLCWEYKQIWIWIRCRIHFIL